MGPRKTLRIFSYVSPKAQPAQLGHFYLSAPGVPTPHSLGKTKRPFSRRGTGVIAVEQRTTADSLITCICAPGRQIDTGDCVEMLRPRPGAYFA